MAYFDQSTYATVSSIVGSLSSIQVTRYANEDYVSNDIQILILNSIVNGPPAVGDLVTQGGKYAHIVAYSDPQITNHYKN